MLQARGSRLNALRSKALAAGEWQLVAATESSLAEPTSMDRQINVVGAMHEVGRLSNQLSPLWKDWRTDAPAWIRRCVERLRASDYDYWALAALLGADVRDAHRALLASGLAVASVRTTSASKRAKGDHFAVYADCPHGKAGFWSPALEIGWNPKSGEIIDAVRWRCVVMENVKTIDGNAIGEGFGSEFLRAAMPHGSWRQKSADIQLLREEAIPRRSTLIK